MKKRMNQKINILAIGAHPDDIEIGCAGTIMKYKEGGAKIFVMVMSDGSFGGHAGTRRREQELSAKIMKVDKIFWGGFKDTKLGYDIQDLINRVEIVLEQVKPSFIFANHPKDTHQDHRSLAAAVTSATRTTRNVLFYEVPTSIDFSPTVFVDISAFMDRKLEALNAHASQIDKTNITGLSISTIAKAAAHFRGTQGRVEYAEGFNPLRLFISI